MNRFDELYSFRQAKIAETDKIMSFIRDEWPKKNHIFAKNKDFFLYEFQDGEMLNFVIAVSHSSNMLDAILGFIPASNIKQSLDIWTCMWLTRRRGSIPFLGIEVFKRIKAITNCRYVTGIGSNQKSALPLTRDFLNRFTFKMRHYYMLSEQKEYKVAVINTIPKPGKPNRMRKSSLKLTNSISEISDHAILSVEYSLPLKDKGYISKRFFDHPIYDYKVWEIVSYLEHGILVGREIDQNGTKILRIVDFIGKPILLDGLFDEFNALKQNYEYIDFYVYGVDDSHLRNAGFTLKVVEDGNVIPNYFEPFVQSNIDVYGSCEVPTMRICKADSDLDRPSSY